jgi:hypothetical protein
MTITINNTDEYLYEKKRDILVLETRAPSEDSPFVIDREQSEKIAEPQLRWFKQRGISSWMTCSPDTLVGWFGHYYIDVDPRDDLVKEYSKEFEDEQGASLNPNLYQMLCLGYDEWVSSGKLVAHEQHLEDSKNTDYW